MSKFKGKYRSESHRLKDWDYSTSGFYFVTINTKNRQHFFGEIRSGIMGLSSVGQLVVEKIHHIPIRHPYTRMDENTITRRYAPRGVSTRGVSTRGVTDVSPINPQSYPKI